MGLRGEVDHHLGGDDFETGRDVVPHDDHVTIDGDGDFSGPTAAVGALEWGAVRLLRGHGLRCGVVAHTVPLTIWKNLSRISGVSNPLVNLEVTMFPLDLTPRISIHPWEPVRTTASPAEVVSVRL